MRPCWLLSHLARVGSMLVDLRSLVRLLDSWQPKCRFTHCSSDHSGVLRETDDCSVFNLNLSVDLTLFRIKDCPSLAAALLLNILSFLIKGCWRNSEWGSTSLLQHQTFTNIKFNEPMRDKSIYVMEVKQSFSDASLALLGHACVTLPGTPRTLPFGSEVSISISIGSRRLSIILPSIDHQQRVFQFLRERIFLHSSLQTSSRFLGFLAYTALLRSLQRILIRSGDCEGHDKTFSWCFLVMVDFEECLGS